MVALIAIFGLGVVAWLVQVLLTLQTWESRRYARSRASQPAPDCHQPVTLIVPCKGHDLDAERNLSALVRQDHPHVEVVFVVESLDDPAVDMIQRVRSRHSRVSTRLVNAGRCVESAQKVHNLIAATEKLPDETAILAFADSDACPSSDWLRHLVARLQEPRIGAVTGYRWFVPQNNNTSNLMLYSINSALAGLLGPGTHYVVWGGAWAIRRDVFEAIDIRTAWRGTLSDDLVAQRALREAGLQVRFEPNCVVTTPMDCDWSAAIEFAQRQYRISRLYLGRWWVAALVTAVLCQTSLWSQLAAALTWDLTVATRAVLALSSLGMLSLMLFRAKLRQDMVDIYTLENAERLRTAKKFDRLASPFVALANVLLLASSSFGRRIRWRGISYLVSPAGRSQLIARRYEPADEGPVILKFPGTEELPASKQPQPLRRAA